MICYQNTRTPDQFFIRLANPEERLNVLRTLKGAGYSMFWGPMTEDKIRDWKDDDYILWGSFSAKHIIGCPGIYCDCHEIKIGEIVGAANTGTESEGRDDDR